MSSWLLQFKKSNNIKLCWVIFCNLCSSPQFPHHVLVWHSLLTEYCFSLDIHVCPRFLVFIIPGPNLSFCPERIPLSDQFWQNQLLSDYWIHTLPVLLNCELWPDNYLVHFCIPNMAHSCRHIVIFRKCPLYHMEYFPTLSFKFVIKNI